MNPILLFAVVTIVGSVTTVIFAILIFKARGLSNKYSIPYVWPAFGVGCLAVAINSVYFDHHHVASVVSVIIQIAVATVALVLNRRSATKPNTT